MKRAKHNLGYYKLFTSNMGELVPVGLTEVLPGDTFQHSTSLLIRMSPMAAPIMHPIQARIHHFFVPHRLVWDGWEDFITGGADGNDAQTIPTRTVPAAAGQQRLYDYYGIPPIENTVVSALPFRGYNAIWNEFYRDQDLQTEIPENNNQLQKVSWEKDYFTTARPWEQKGDAITLPIGETAPIALASQLDNNLVSPGGGSDQVQLEMGAAESGPLVADLSQAEAININEFRRAFALQRYAEARAKYGSRYTEYLRYLGVKPSDARLQRPEYLGGGRVNMSISEILQTAPEISGGPPESHTDYGVGDLYGHGIAATRSNRYRRFFEEHGYVHSFMSVRPKSIYQDGIPRHFLKSDREDFYQRELTHIGQQPIKNNEVFADLVAGDQTFGYQDRYDEYRRNPSQVAAEFRDILNYWHLGRKFETPPVLNASFIECDPSKRIFNEQTQHSLWCMAQHRLVARRLVGRRAMSRII